MKQDEMTICECIEYLDSIVGDDKEIKDCLDYIECKAKSMDKKLREYKSIFEEKQETNLERYYDDLIKEDCSDFCVVNGKIKSCAYIQCKKCEFECGNCHKNRITWLTSKCKKTTYKLTQCEYDMLDTIFEKKARFSKVYFIGELKNKGYFKNIKCDSEVRVEDILANCEVVG